MVVDKETNVGHGVIYQIEAKVGVTPVKVVHIVEIGTIKTNAVLVHNVVLHAIRFKNELFNGIYRMG